MAETIDDIVWELSDTKRMWWNWAMQCYYAHLSRSERRSFGRRLAACMLARENKESR